MCVCVESARVCMCVCGGGLLENFTYNPLGVELAGDVADGLVVEVIVVVV